MTSGKIEEPATAYFFGKMSRKNEQETCCCLLYTLIILCSQLSVVAVTPTVLG